MRCLVFLALIGVAACSTADRFFLQLDKGLVEVSNLEVSPWGFGLARHVEGARVQQSVPDLLSRVAWGKASLVGGPAGGSGTMLTSLFEGTGFQGAVTVIRTRPSGRVLEAWTSVVETTSVAFDTRNIGRTRQPLIAIGLQFTGKGTPAPPLPPRLNVKELSPFAAIEAITVADAKGNTSNIPFGGEGQFFASSTQFSTPLAASGRPGRLSMVTEYFLPLDSLTARVQSEQEGLAAKGLPWNADLALSYQVTLTSEDRSSHVLSLPNNALLAAEVQTVTGTLNVRRGGSLARVRANGR
jgi:hypothetical protein